MRSTSSASVGSSGLPAVGAKSRISTRPSSPTCGYGHSEMATVAPRARESAVAPSNAAVRFATSSGVPSVPSRLYATASAQAVRSPSWASGSSIPPSGIRTPTVRWEPAEVEPAAAAP